MNVLVNLALPHRLKNDADVVPNGKLVIKLGVCTRRFDVRVEFHQGRGQVLLSNRMRHNASVESLRAPSLQVRINQEQDFHLQSKGQVLLKG